MKGKMRVPDDFETMYADEITRLFHGGIENAFIARYLLAGVGGK